MTSLALLYFPFPGRAAAIRDTLNIGGIPFEDRHVGRDEFRRMKEQGELPFGSMPVLEVAGESPRRIAQSNAILRYAGRLAGTYPVDPLEALRVDEMMDFAEDVNHALGPSLREPDPEKKLAMRRTLAEVVIPSWCRSVEAKLASNGDPQHLVGAALTVADLKLFHVFESLVSGVLDGIPTTVLDGYVALGTWRESVRAERAAKLAAGGGA